MTKKYKIYLISSLATLLFAVILLGAVSFAWLSMNKKVDTSNMQLSIQTSPNLVISSSSADIASASFDDINGGAQFVVTASTNAVLAPATHVASAAEYATYASGLKYVTNKSDVSYTTGLAASYTYAAAVSPTHYVDVVVYVASYAQAMETSKLQATITSAQKASVDVTTGSLMATSIDFYLGEVGSGTYLGTSNVATKSSVYIIGGESTTGTIPLNTSSSLKITMRCYFDGALSNAGTAYINSATLDTSKININVSFTATTAD